MSLRVPQVIDVSALLLQEESQPVVEAADTQTLVLAHEHVLERAAVRVSVRAASIRPEPQPLDGFSERSFVPGKMT